MKYYLHNQDDVLKTLNSTKDGLSESEANSRLERDGKNKLAEGKKVTAFQRFLSHFPFLYSLKSLRIYYVVS